MIRNDSRALKIVLLVLILIFSFTGFTMCSLPVRMKEIRDGEIDWYRVDEIEVEAGRKGKGSISVLDAGEGSVRGRVNSWRLSGGKLELELGKEDIEIALPPSDKKFSLELESASGNIYISTRNARKIDAESASGRIKVMNTSAEEAELSAVSGKIEVLSSSFLTLETENVSGSTEINTKANRIESSSVSGGISIEAEKATVIDAETISGSLEIRTDMKNPRISFESVSGKEEWTGNAELSIPSDGEIRAKSISGNLKIHLGT